MPQTEEPRTQRPLVVTVREASELLAISERTVWRLVATGKLKAIRLCRARRIRVEAIETLLARGGTR